MEGFLNYIEKQLDITNIKLEEQITECIVRSESKKKNISIDEENKFQLNEHSKDEIFYPWIIQFIELLLDIENKFQINILDEEADELRTIQDLITLVDKKLEIK